MDNADYRKKMEHRTSEIKHIQDLLKKGGCCIICSFNRDPRILELHHIAGRKNSKIVIPVCPNCHRILSMGQEPKKVERGKDDKTDQERIAWNLEGHARLLRLLSFELQNHSDNLLRGDFNG